MKKNEVKKSDKTINVLKISGLLINVIGFFIYLITIANKTIINASNIAIYLVKDKGIDEVMHPQMGSNVFAPLNEYWLVVIALIIMTMGIVLIYELVNYIFYLKNNKKALLIALIIESVAFVILTGLRAFDYLHLQTFALLIPILTGLINLLIIKVEAK